MPKKDIEINLFQVVEKTLATLGKNFEPNELEYLAVTGKIETIVRDKLAYLLFTCRDLKPFIVNREWKKIDIAIIRKTNGRALRAAVALQLKAKSST